MTRATLRGELIAESDDIVEVGGYRYFPNAAVRTALLVKAAKTDSDHACPHGVQFYDVVDGRCDARAAWRYEAPRASMQRVADRFAFWNDVEVG